MQKTKLKLELNSVEEPQLAVKFYSKTKIDKKGNTEKSTLNLLSLFSGCGGMDLGFEGDFSVLKSSVNEILNPNTYIKVDSGQQTDEDTFEDIE